MTKIMFNGNSAPSLGVEIELGLIDAETMELSNSCNRLLGDLEKAGISHYKPELMQSCIEINTNVCMNVGEARADLSRKLKTLQSFADKNSIQLWWGATHPFSRWKDQIVTDNERYLGLVDSLQEMARRLVTYGLHVHVGVESGDKAIMICDRIMQHLPTLLAISCSSPYWESRDTGLQSHRTKIMEGLPTAGLPPLMRNWSEYVWLVNHMVETGFISTIREIWWDVRPHHNFGTVEVRVCDMPGSLDDACAIAALIQCLVRSLSEEIDGGTYQFDCHPVMIRQNKWRACRFGLNARLVNSYTYEVESVPVIANKMVDQLGDIATELGCRDDLEYIREIVKGQTWSDRQRAILTATSRPQEVVRQMVRQARID